jgi:hypothetical protein
MTHPYDGFKCSSLRDNVDTKSWLANEQKPYLTHKIRYESLNQHDLKSVGSQVMNLRIDKKSSWWTIEVIFMET